MAWTPRDSVNAPVEGGIIKLWHSPNLFENTGWFTDGKYGEDLFYYFIIPPSFVYDSKDTFLYNFALKYVNSSVSVSGFIDHDGWHSLQQGKTAPFWHLELNSSPEKVKLQTDDLTKLPYLLKPANGLPNFKEEKCYFIPLPESA